MYRVLACLIAAGLLAACSSPGGDAADPAAGDAATAADTAGGAAPADTSGGAMPSTYPGEAATGPEEATTTGLKSMLIAAGTGAQAVNGQTVDVHYSGYLLDGTPFDSSLSRGQPISFVLGNDQIIQGWHEGVALMKVGEKRKLIIPPDLAYGPAGRPPVIPANATLVFDVELVAAR